MLRGAGTALNVATILVGGGAGVLLGARLPERVRTTVTAGLGLTTLLIAGSDALAVRDAALVRATGRGAPTLVVLGALLIGGVLGSLARVEDRLAAAGGRLQGWLTRRGRRHGGRFVEGFVAASLVFCVGPLALLGALSDGLGKGIDQLALKACLDGFASLAFAAAYGPGVLVSALSVGVLQGTVTVVGVLLGGVLSAAAVAAITAVGGLLLVGVALRLLGVMAVPVADLLPALLVAPLLGGVAHLVH